MNMETLKQQTWVLDCNLSRNFRYYRCLYFTFAALERMVRFAVGVLAVLSLLAATTHAWQDDAFSIAVTSVVVAILLNILPLHGYELTTRVLMEKYVALHGKLRQFESHTFGFLFADGEDFIRHRFETEHTNVPQRTQKAFEDIVAAYHDTETTEVFDFGPLNAHCQKLDRQSRWGRSVQTVEEEQKQIDALMAKWHPARDNSPAQEPAPA